MVYKMVAVYVIYLSSCNKIGITMVFASMVYC